MKAPRRQKRYDYLLSAELTINDETVNGQIINWSEGGIQLLSVIPIDKDIPYRVNFLLERQRFGEDSQLNEDTWEREGSVVWSYPYKDGSWIGIKLDSIIDIPFEQIHEFLSAGDFCHVSFFTESEQGSATDSIEESPSEIEPSYQWYHWGIWGMVVILEIWILILLWQGQ